MSYQAGVLKKKNLSERPICNPAFRISTEMNPKIGL